MPKCMVEQLLAWIHAASSKGDPEKFQIGRLVFKEWEKKCSSFLNDRYLEGKDISLSLLESRIGKLESIFRDFLRSTLRSMHDRTVEDNIPIPFNLPAPQLFKRIFPKICLEFLSQVQNQGEIQKIKKKKTPKGYVPPSRTVVNE